MFNYKEWTLFSRFYGSAYDVKQYLDSLRDDDIGKDFKYKAIIKGWE